MRKLRRLPWRLPKSNKPDAKQSTTPIAPPREPEYIAPREALSTQPVAFTAGRYVYGDTPSVPCATEVRHKARHRVVAVAT